MTNILLGLIEIAGFSFLLSVVFTQFRLGNTSFLPCVGLTLFLFWVAQKVIDIEQTTEVDKDGQQ